MKLTEKKTYLVTGGAGFIGSHLCEALLKKGQRVLCIDNLCDFYDPDIKSDNLKSLITQAGFSFYKADVRDSEALHKIFSDNAIDMVIHLAAMAGVLPSIANPELYLDVNVVGTQKLLEVCRLHGLDKFIFASSSSIYGNNDVPFKEHDRVDHPISPYAASKKSGELLCYTWHQLYRLSTICLRFFTVYGPRQRPDLAIHKFASSIMSGKTIPMYGNGSTARDYTYVKDTVEGIMGAVERINNSPEKLYEIYNLGNSQPITLNEMIAKLEQVLNKKAKISHEAMQPGDVQCTYADISLARKYLKYNPATHFDEGLASFASWLRAKS